MKKIIFFSILSILFFSVLRASPPSRSFTYTSGTTIQPDEVTVNEDNIFNYLNRGIDKIIDGTVTTDTILDGTIANVDLSGTLALPDSKIANITTASKVNGTALTGLASIPSGAGKVPAANLNLTGGNFALPSGAVFFMITGSCPTGSTDVTATYSDKFLKVHDTQGTTGGSATDSITLTTNEMPAHTHNISGKYDGGPTSNQYISFTATVNDKSQATTSAGSGNAFTVDTVPPFVTCKLCQVD